jgi:hypothetical protein
MDGGVGRRIQLSWCTAALVCVSAAFALSPAGAMAAKSKNRSSCSVGGGLFSSGEEQVPTEVSTPLDPSVVSSFAVLRRAQAPSDLIPPLSPVGISLDYELRSFYPAYVRRVATIKGARYYLIPAFLREAKIPPARCLPPSERKDRAKYVELERKRGSSPAYCIVKVGRPGAEAGGCEPFDTLTSGSRAFAGSLFASPLVELAPDGITAVRINYLKALPITVPTSENVYAFEAPQTVVRRLKHIFQGILRPAQGRHLSKKQRHQQQRRFERAFERLLREAVPTKIEWLGPGGVLVRLISRPRETLGPGS